MRRLQPLGHLDRQRQHFYFRDLATLADLVFEMAAWDQFHRNIKSAESLTCPQHPDHMRMAKRGRNAGLLLKCGDPLFVR